MITLDIENGPACAKPSRMTVTHWLNHAKNLSLITLLASLNGCAFFHAPPCPEDMALLPVVEFPNTPPAGDFILKLPSGKPIPLTVSVRGSLLTQEVAHTLESTISRDLFLHKEWASWDGKNWQAAADLVGVDLRLALPSYEHPKPGEIVLQVDQKRRR
jgi:hypothetical protein